MWLTFKAIWQEAQKRIKVQPFAQWRFYTLFLSPKVHLISESKMYTCSIKLSWDKTWAEGRGRKSEPRNETIIRSTWCIFRLLASTRRKKKVNSRFRCLSEYHFSSSMKYSKTVLKQYKNEKHTHLLMWKTYFFQPCHVIFQHLQQSGLLERGTGRRQSNLHKIMISAN